MKFIWKTFEQLLKEELYNILRLRQEIFAVEQNSVYLDVDGKDQNAQHLLVYNQNNNLAAYLRIVAPKERFLVPSIGRVIVLAEARGMGLGKEMMVRAIKRVNDIYPGMDIRLSAQEHLERFYAGFGFKRDSEPYQEDGIPHLEMVLRRG
jgi:ElaA protein